MHNGLYYLSTNEKSMNSSLMGYALSAEGATSELMLHHRRLGHIPFSILSRLFPSLSTKCNKNLLVCDHVNWLNTPEQYFLYLKLEVLNFLF